MNASPSTRRAVLGTYYTIPEVAARLEWHESTIRRHVVPIEEWKRGSGKVPGVRRGDRGVVPAWWLAETIAVAHEPPPDEQP